MKTRNRMKELNKLRKNIPQNYQNFSQINSYLLKRTIKEKLRMNFIEQQ